MGGNSYNNYQTDQRICVGEMSTVQFWGFSSRVFDFYTDLVSCLGHLNKFVILFDRNHSSQRDDLKKRSSQ